MNPIVRLVDPEPSPQKGWNFLDWATGISGALVDSGVIAAILAAHRHDGHRGERGRWCTHPACQATHRGRLMDERHVHACTEDQDACMRRVLPGVEISLPA